MECLLNWFLSGRTRPRIRFICSKGSFYCDNLIGIYLHAWFDLICTAPCEVCDAVCWRLISLLSSPPPLQLPHLFIHPLQSCFQPNHDTKTMPGAKTQGYFLTHHGISSCQHSCLFLLWWQFSLLLLFWLSGLQSPFCLQKFFRGLSYSLF
jgi:hypothetical protein